MTSNKVAAGMIFVPVLLLVLLLNNLYYTWYYNLTPWQCHVYELLTTCLLQIFQKSHYIF